VSGAGATGARLGLTVAGGLVARAESGGTGGFGGLGAGAEEKPDVEAWRTLTGWSSARERIGFDACIGALATGEGAGARTAVRAAVVGVAVAGETVGEVAGAGGRATGGGVAAADACGLAGDRLAARGPGDEGTEVGARCAVGGVLDLVGGFALPAIPNFPIT
jgi:hypothetical protein